MQAEVSISKSAIFELVNAAVEAYVVKHDYSREIAVETFSYMFGKVNKRLPLKCHIDHVSVDTSAQKRRGSVRTKKLSYDIKKELSELFGDGFDLIGTMHTHPWLKDEVSTKGVVESAEHVRRYQLYLLSSADHTCEINRSFSVGNRSFSIASTITLFAMQRANDRKDYSQADLPCLHEVTLGNLKMWFYVQAFEHIENNKLTDEQKKAFEKYGLSSNDYKPHQVLPIPIDTILDKDELITTFVGEGFGRFFINQDEKNGLYLAKNISETREFYR